MSKVGVLVMRKRNWYLTSNIQKRWSSCCCSVTKNDTCYGVRPCYVTFAWITRSERPKDAKERCPKSIQLEVRPQKSPRLLVFYIDDSTFLWQQLLFVVIPGSRPMHVAVPQLVESLSKPTGKKNHVWGFVFDQWPVLLRRTVIAIIWSSSDLFLCKASFISLKKSF